MSITQPRHVPPARHDDHDHDWRRVDAGTPVQETAVQEWAYRCQICHRTWVGFVA